MADDPDAVCAVIHALNQWMHEHWSFVYEDAIYASPIIYGVTNLPPELHVWSAFNPLTGIFGLYRSGFFPDELDWFNVAIAAVMSIAILVIGLLVFRGSVRQVLKEI